MNNEQRVPEEEVNFEPLIGAILSVFSSIGFFFRIIFNVFKSQKKTVFITLLISGILGLLLYSFAPKSFKTSLTLESRVIENSTSALLLGKLEKLFDDKSYKNLGQLLNLSPELVKNINGVSFKNLGYNLSSDVDTIVEGVPFNIELSIQSKITAEQLESALMNYLNNSPFIVRIQKERRAYLENQIDNLKIQVTQLDSLKTIVANSIREKSAGSGLVYGEPIDPVKVNQQREDRYNYLLKLQSELASLNAYTVVSGVTISEKASFPRIRHALALVVIGLFLAIAIGFSASRNELLASV